MSTGEKQRYFPYAWDSGHSAAMEAQRKWGWIGVAIFWGAYAADKLSTTRNVVEAPSNVLWLWGVVRNMFDITPTGLLFLIAGAACLLAALWRPEYAQFLRTALPSATATTHQRGSLVAMTDKPKNVFHIGDDNTVTNVHVGDVNQAPEPELRIGPETQTENADGTVVTRIAAEVVAPYPPGDLYIEAHAEGVISLRVSQQRAGMQMSGHCGTRPTFAFYTVQSPFGRYLIEVATRKRTKISINYQFR